MTTRFGTIIVIAGAADVVGASIRKPPICPRCRRRLPFETNDQGHRTAPRQSAGCPYRDRRDFHLAHFPVLDAGGPLAAPVELRPTGSAGAALTEIGRVSPGLHVTVQAEPLIRKSSVWVAQSWIGPGRSVLTTEAAARRSHSSTRHITGVSTVISPPGEPPTIPIPAAVPRLASCDSALGVFFVLLLATLLFYRLRRLLGYRLAGRLVCHVCPLSSTPPYSHWRSALSVAETPQRAALLEGRSTRRPCSTVLGDLYGPEQFGQAESVIGLVGPPGGQRHDGPHRLVIQRLVPSLQSHFSCLQD